MTLREAEGAEGGVTGGVASIVNSSGRSSSEKSRFNPQLMVGSSLSISRMWGKEPAKSMIKSDNCQSYPLS